MDHRHNSNFQCPVFDETITKKTISYMALIGDDEEEMVDSDDGDDMDSEDLVKITAEVVDFRRPYVVLRRLRELVLEQAKSHASTTCHRASRIVQIQATLSERALELLALPDDDIPNLPFDIGCGSGLSGETILENGHHWIRLDISASMLNVAVEREVEGDLLLGDMGQGLGIRPGVMDGAISISAV
ncbi:18S rRNA (guanine-N(7))-methyltransferase RID2-like [Glycine soja]|uniref:18S rRNA (guanine-N(7))-methyltransferase RID2-like n=1 Tax=Glycine max TaxID=3847 RepID=UPI0007192C84|nr:18S rRNA (guanine-N(7))-methyltransferase RID2-like [Glycine max]XP_028199434.1 18S rRNA (guanine-N(7))-methyltransferase RID2-like [Glycine soja]|eukprot:XP_014622267.1 18S rRNA (guanine-N(7))-methyltransferase RID2-like [Glycine max]